ncbi:sulfotransferase domain-containing protein [Benzoatithermus flavus]|uniref:Sulfotransferase domain-containing protein n=1 Tax=Benzoatithermus flavus TaxID=3108223 RepID=A0ABU8XN85_9PROT
MRRKIDFFLVGAQKSGTTSLHRYLQLHPRIFLPFRKEIACFVLEEQYRRLEQELALNYPETIDAELVGLSNVELLFFPYVPERLRRYNPDARIVAVLRNPIDRAYSAYWYQRSVGVEPAGSFEEALAREPALDPTSTHDRAQRAYLEHGHYAEQLERFRRWFPPERIHVLLYDDMQQDSRYLSRLLGWLGIDDPTFEPPEERHNTASVPRFPRLQRMLRAPDSRVNRAYKAVVPARLRYFLFRHVVEPLSEANARPFRYPPMHEETRERLRAYFRPHNERLSALLGRDLAHWV